MGGGLALSGTYEELFTYVMFMMVLSYVLTVAALFVLRRNSPMRRARIAAPESVATRTLCSPGKLWAVNAVVEKRRDADRHPDRTGGNAFLFWWKRKKKATVP